MLILREKFVSLHMIQNEKNVTKSVKLPRKGNPFCCKDNMQTTCPV
jgi:hypothetical protein